MPGAIGWDLQLTLNGDGSCTGIELWQGKTEQRIGGWTVTGGKLNIMVGEYNWIGAYVAGDSSFQLSGVPNYDGEGDTGSFVFTRQ